MFRNPLAEPFTLGISSGASCGAALTILLGLGSIFPGIPIVSLGALCGAFVAIILVYGFSRIHQYADSHSMLLSGIVVSFLFSSVMMFVQYLSNLRDSFYIVRWLMGGLEVFGYSQIIIMIVLIVSGSIIISWKLPEIDLLLTGYDVAQSRGVNIAKTNTLLLLAVTLIAGSIVAQCGPIGFIGLIVPFIARSIFPINHKVLCPIAFLIGGAFLVFCDTCARTLFAPTEIPVGVITSMIGAPFFLWLLLFKKSNQRGIF
jgi:iron complex transport system permease protein